jgi:hypothetical protein
MRVITGVVNHRHQGALVGTVVLTKALFDFSARHSLAHPAASFVWVKVETSGFCHTVAQDVFGAGQITVLGRKLLELLSRNSIPQALPITSC